MWRELISWQYWIFPLVKTPTYLFRSRINPHLQYIFFLNLSLLRGNISISCLYYSTGPHYQPLEFSKKCQSDPTEKPSLESLFSRDRAMARQANSSSSFLYAFVTVFLRTQSVFFCSTSNILSYLLPVLHPSVHTRRAGTGLSTFGVMTRGLAHRGSSSNICWMI